MKLIKVLLAVQSFYILMTGVWPIIDIESFMAVTGPKQDVWLVKTVGALLIPVALCLGSFMYIDVDKRPAIILGAGIAISFIAIDFYYALNDVISNIYLLDGVLELMFLIGWVLVAVSEARQKNFQH